MKRQMCKKMISAFLAVVMVLLCVPMTVVEANAGSEGNNSYVVKSGEAVSKGLAFTSNGDGTCYVSDIGTCTDKDIVIPEKSPEGYIVTGIGHRAFDSRSGITRVIIPDSVTDIGYGAFYNCTSLTSAVIGDGVTIIGEWAFGECRSLTRVVIPEGSISIGDYVFYFCGNLTEAD